MNWLKRIERFTALNFRGKLLLLKLTLIVAIIEISLRLLGFKKVVALLLRFAKKTKSATDISEKIQKYKKLIFLVSRIFPFAGKCLARSLALWWLLRNSGIETELKIGMQKKDGKMAGHAWVEYQEKPLVFNQNVAYNYTVLDKLVLPKSAEFAENLKFIKK
jgi:hypothetical protein